MKELLSERIQRVTQEFQDNYRITGEWDHRLRRAPQSNRAPIGNGGCDGAFQNLGGFPLGGLPFYWGGAVFPSTGMALSLSSGCLGRIGEAILVPGLWECFGFLFSSWLVPRLAETVAELSQTGSEGPKYPISSSGKEVEVGE